MKNNVKDVTVALARAFANYDVPDEKVEVVANQLAAVNHKLYGINVCERGFCCDFIIDAKEWWVTLPELANVQNGYLRRIEVFPWGIVAPDVLHVRIEQELDVLPGLGS